MKTKIATFTIKPFRNRNGVISHRVAGWLLGERIRKNYKTREEAILARGAFKLRQAQADSDIRVTSTLLSEPQLREAETMFAKLRDKPRSLTFYLNFALANHTEPNLRQPVADAITDYLAERAKDAAQGRICQRQLSSIRIELALFQKHFPDRCAGELTTDELLAYIRRENAALRTQNNRRALLFTFFKHAHAKGWVDKNPLEGTKRHRVDHKRGSATALTSQQAAELMAHVETFEDGAFVPFFALCLFAGIRPDGEISKLPASDVHLENNAINIEPEVSKVNMRRLVTIQPNLAAWLRSYPLSEYPLMPPKEKVKNVIGKLSALRKRFKLAHDVLRHTFISMHVAKFRSMGDTALQAGNSESIIRRHYLNVTTAREADAFFNIMPLRRTAPETKAPAASASTTPVARAA